MRRKSGHNENSVQKSYFERQHWQIMLIAAHGRTLLIQSLCEACIKGALHQHQTSFHSAALRYRARVALDIQCYQAVGERGPGAVAMMGGHNRGGANRDAARRLPQLVQVMTAEAVADMDCPNTSFCPLQGLACTFTSCNAHALASPPNHAPSIRCLCVQSAT